MSVSPLARALVSAALLLPAAPPLGAEEIFLEIDPFRSQVTLASGSQSVLPLPQNFSGFGFGDQVLTHVAQPGLPAGQLPNGSASDGRTAALGGLLRVDVGDPDAPSQIRFVRESSSILLLPSGSWRPGVPPGLATSVAPAALALRLENVVLGLATETALRDAALSVASTSGAALAATGPDAWNFPAGCTGPTPSCPELRFEEAIFDAAVNGGVVLRRGFRSPAAFRNPAGVQGTLTREASGELELTMPIDVTVPIAASDVNDPFGTLHTLVLSGQLVAVPEPSAAALGLGALLALGGLRGWRRRRHGSGRSVLAASLALLAGLGTTGCELLYDDLLDEPSFYSISCQYEFLAVRKLGGTQTISTDMGNQPCSFAGRAANGIFDGVNFGLLAKVSYQPGQMYVKPSITMNPVSTLPSNAEIDYRASFRIDYGAATLGGPMQFYFGGSATGLGAALGESANGWVEIGGLQYTLDGTIRYRDLDPAGGSLDFTVGLDSLRMAAGKGVQGAALQFGVRPNACSDNKQCEWADPATPFCGGNGIAAFCTDGEVGAPCTHSSQCEYDLSCRGGSCQKLNLQLRF